MNFIKHGINPRDIVRHRALVSLLCVIFPLYACVSVETVPAPEKKAENTQQQKQKTNNKNKEIINTDKNPWDKHQLTAKENHQKQKEQNKGNINQLKRNFNVKNRMSLNTSPLVTPKKTYSFTTEYADIQVALRVFANKYKINMFIDQDIDGEVSVDFRKLSLKKAMALLLGSHDYYWAWQDDLIRISRLQTKIFVVDYLRLTRSGQTATNSSVSNIPSNKNRDGNDNERNAISIQQNDNLAFWDELNNQLSSLISDNGRLVVNRLSGTIQVTDNPARIKEVSSFITSLKSALHRQVEIDARIIEVSLHDDNALGVDWSAISIAGITGSLTNAISTNNNGINLKSNTLAIGYNHSKFTALITALSEQGEIRVVSQPRIRVLNNQPSLIKVGTDRTFFTQTESRLVTTAGAANVTISDDPITITEGLVLSVTPQISSDRWIMLDISPVITRIVGTTISKLGSTAPVLDIKQASTLIRARDGEMVILGGLIQDEISETKRKVPFLSSLPLVGHFFDASYSTKVKKELIIFLSPRLIL